jgi:hypothetical protein
MHDINGLITPTPARISSTMYDIGFIAIKLGYIMSKLMVVDLDVSAPLMCALANSCAVHTSNTMTELSLLMSWFAVEISMDAKEGISSCVLQDSVAVSKNKTKIKILINFM